MWLEVSGFMVMGLVSGLFLANHSDSGSFWWCVHCLAKMDASKEDSGRPVGYIACLSDLSLILPVGGDLLVLRALPGPPVCKITHLNGHCGVWPGRAVSGSVFPLTLRGSLRPLEANLNFQGIPEGIW